MPTSAPFSESKRAVSRARVAVTAVFVAQAVLGLSWIAHIPQLKRDLGLSNGSLGLALLGSPIGAVAAMAAAGWLLPRLGSRFMVRVTLLGYCATGVGVGVARSWLELFVALVVWGAFQGALDTSMNTQAVTVERAIGRPVMSGIHGSWSVGAFAGATLGTGSVALGLGLDVHLVVLGAIVLVAGGALTHWLLSDATQRREAGSGRTGWSLLWRPAVLILALMAFASMLCEGAAADWSAVYLRDSLSTGPAIAGFGYAMFSGAMLALRLAGNRLLTRYSPGRFLASSAAVATVGFGAALLIGTPVAAMIGLVFLGVGLACFVPTVISLAGKLPNVDHGPAIAAVSAFGWVAFVAGPPLIGWVADATSLPLALGLIPALTALLVVMAIRGGEGQRGTEEPAGAAVSVAHELVRD